MTGCLSVSYTKSQANYNAITTPLVKWQNVCHIEFLLQDNYKKNNVAHFKCYSFTINQSDNCYSTFLINTLNLVNIVLDVLVSLRHYGRYASRSHAHTVHGVHGSKYVQVHYWMKTCIPHNTINPTNPSVLTLPVTFSQVLDMSE